MNRGAAGRLSANIFKISVFMGSLFLLAACQTKPYQQELAETYYNLGNAYIELEQWNEAETAFARAIEIQPDLYRAEYNMARVYIHSKNFNRAVDILNTLLERDPENVVFLETLAWAEAKWGRLERAEKIYRSLLKSDPANCNVRYNLALMLIERKEYAEAYSLLIECVYQGGADWQILIRMGNLEIELGWGNGIGWFEKALEKAPQEKRVLESLAAVYEEEGMHTEALETYRRLSGSADSSERGKYLLEQAGILYLQMEEQQQGQDMLEAALEAGIDEDTELLTEFYTSILSTGDADLQTGVETLLRRYQLLESVQAAAEPETPEAETPEAD